LTVLTTDKGGQELRETDIVSAMTARTALTVLTTDKGGLELRETDDGRCNDC
jgi:hypothetical protein